MPVKLLIVALQEAELAEEPEFRLARKRHVHAGGAGDAAQLDQAAGQRVARPRAASAPSRTNSRGPVAGVNGTATCSFG